MICKNCVSLVEQNINKKDAINGNKGNPRLLMIVLIIITLISLSGFLILLMKQNDMTDGTFFVDNRWSGVYKHGDDTTLRVYQIDNDTIFYAIEQKNIVDDDGDTSNYFDSEYVEIKDNVAVTLESDSCSTLELLGDKIHFFGSDEGKKREYKLTKVSDFTLEEFYNYVMGTSMTINSQYNGEFVNDNIKIELYQAGSNFSVNVVVVSIIIDGKYIVNNLSYRLVDGWFVRYNDDYEPVVKMKIEDDKLTVVSYVEDDAMFYSEIGGVYKKTKTYTLKDIVGFSIH